MLTSIIRHVSAVAWFVAGLCSLGACVAAADTVIDVNGRPVTVIEPSGYDPETPTPVLMLLHGWGMSGSLQESLMNFGPVVEAEGFLFLHPDGLRDILLRRYWDATPACCNFFAAPVDDSAYLIALIDEVKLRYNVDHKRVYVVGYSNGGFMAHRLACEHSDAFAAAVSVAGSTFADAADCAPPPPTPPLLPKPQEPIHVAEIHGTSDATIFYLGGSYFGNPYPGAEATVQTWTTINGCSPAADTSSPDLDLVVSPAGFETDVVRYEGDCGPNGSAQLWTVNGAPHDLDYTANFSRDVMNYLLAHAKEEPVCPPWICPSGLSSGWRIKLLIRDQ